MKRIFSPLVWLLLSTLPLGMFTTFNIFFPETPAEMVLVKNHYISLDPANRQWMTEVPSYYPPIPLGEPL